MIRTAEQREIIRAADEIKRSERKEAKANRPKVERPDRIVLPRSEKADRGRVRDNGYLAYLRRQPCRVGPVGCAGPIQACHLRYGDAAHGRVNPGVQTKPSDAWATSLCATHHAEQHAAGNERAWWAGYGFDGSEVAISQHRQYQEG